MTRGIIVLVICVLVTGTSLVRAVRLYPQDWLLFLIGGVLAAGVGVVWGFSMRRG